jgi:AraC-like DNA-binding protein
MRGLPSHRVETLPHPSVHLIFEDGLGGQVSGITKGKFTRLLSGLGGVFAAKFRPGGFYPFVRTPVAGFADTTLSPGRVWGRDGDALERDVSSQAGDDGRMAVIEAFLRARRPEPDEHAALSGKVVETIASDRELRTMDDVARRFGLNPRTLQRLFARYIGVNPKWVIQRYRLHEAAEQLAAGTGSQSALALELGYADQAHFINDFKAIVGVSPAAYARRARPG